MTNTFIAKKTGEDFSIEAFNNADWDRAEPVHITKLWSGEDAPFERHAEVCSLWSDEFLYVRFFCNQTEPLVVSDNPQTETKTIGLWDRDVCEIFIAPNPEEPNRYFEFEAAPTGEWVDLELHQMPERRETNPGYESKMMVAAKIEDEKVMIIIRIPFSSLRAMPKATDGWRVNLFRCIGAGDSRYLAWQPTHTQTPNFHVPEAFGWIYFQE
jgi:alpha-galactosidase